MSETLAKYMKGDGSGGDKPKKKQPHPNESRALDKLRAEAGEQGATLQSDGEGGLPSSLVLGIFRRDGYRCKRCGGRDELSLHHKGGIVASKWLSKKGHSNDPNNISVICKDCHDDIHNEAREDGTDSSQVLPEGDKGNPKRDHGQPDADA